MAINNKLACELKVRKRILKAILKYFKDIWNVVGKTKGLPLDKNHYNFGEKRDL